MPKNLKEVESFLGMVNYYSKFVAGMAEMVEPLNELRRKDQPWSWGSQQQQAFEKIKKELMSDKVLVHYNPSKPLFLATDASDYGMGAVLFHKEEKTGREGVTAFKNGEPRGKNMHRLRKRRELLFLASRNLNSIYTDVNSLFGRIMSP